MRLEMRSVTAGYGESVILRDINLVVPEGRVVALLGPNGAGKTTLLSTTSGLVRPLSGRVILGGKDHTTSSIESRVAAGLCHVTEGGAIFPGMTVAENIRMFAGNRDEAGTLERAIDAFPKLGQRLGQMAGTLSGGEQRMLALARTHARNPSLILLDEISLGLAPIIIDEIFEFLSHLRAQGTSMLVVEQYVARVLGLADLAYVLVRGRIVFAGEPTELDGSDIMSHYLGSGKQGDSSSLATPADQFSVR
jgi:branched-chain amino acid transport system ATP-binding protein